jgi:hypothetical protein
MGDDPSGAGGHSHHHRELLRLPAVVEGLLHRNSKARVIHGSDSGVWYVQGVRLRGEPVDYWPGSGIRSLPGVEVGRGGGEDSDGGIALQR